MDSWWGGRDRFRSFLFGRRLPGTIGAPARLAGCGVFSSAADASATDACSGPLRTDWEGTAGNVTGGGAHPLLERPLEVQALMAQTPRSLGVPFSQAIIRRSPQPLWVWSLFPAASFRAAGSSDEVRNSDSSHVGRARDRLAGHSFPGNRWYDGSAQQSITFRARCQGAKPRKSANPCSVTTTCTECSL